jgi:Trp operon repressor
VRQPKIKDQMMNNKPRIETRIASRSKSIFAAFGQIINDFYLEAGIYFVGGFNAALVAWDIYTDLLANDQPLLYAIGLAIIAFIAVEGLAVYLVGAAAKTNNGLLWFFSVAFATFFTFAHYQEMTTHNGIISQYIMLAIPFFVVIGYWARTVKADIENDHESKVIKERSEQARLQQIEDEDRRFQREEKRAKREEKHLERMVQLEVQKEVSLKGQPLLNNNSTRLNPSIDTVNDTKKMNADTRRKKVLELLDNNTSYPKIAAELGVSLSTIKRDIKELNGSVK